MDERQRHLEVLAINRAIAGAGDEAEILRLVVDRTAAITGATACVLLLAGKDGLARVVRSAGVYPVNAAQVAVPLSEHLDVELRDRLGVKSEDGFAGAPVIGKAGLRGILAIYRKSSQAVAPSGDEEMLSAFADQAAIALDHVESKRLLREAEAQSRSIVTAMAEGVVMQDASGKIIQCNGAAERILGLSRDQMEGRTSVDPLWRSVHEDGSPFPGKEHPAMLALRTGEAVSDAVMGVHRPDGTLSWISINAEPVRAEPGVPPHAVVATFTDITAQADRARELREAKEQLVRVLEGSNDGYWDWNMQNGQVDFSDRWAEMFGYDRTELAPSLSTWQGMVHPDDREDARGAFGRIMEGKMDRYEVERRLRHRDGHWVWVHVRGKVVEWSGDGKPTRMAGTYTDISGRKQDEEALAASEAKYRRLFDSLMDGLVVVGMDGFIRESNEVYRRMLGYSAEELARVTYVNLTPERWHPVEARVIAEQVLPRGYSEVYEKEYRRKDGTIFPIELRTLLLKEDGHPVAMWAIVRDVTDVRALQKRFTIAGRMAALGTLVSGVAHEINNPLAAEMADQGIALEVVRELRQRLRGDAPIDRESEGRALDGVVEALQDAKESGERIARIVKDLTLFGRPDAKRQRARLMDIIDGALRWVPATVARTASIQVENGGAPDVLASVGQIEQVLVNLVMNAAKATPEGMRDTVIVRVGPGLDGMARVEVIDHGTGIDPDIRDHLFDPFFTTRPVGPERGTGLGLAICQAIVTAHHGTLTFESEVGRGSTFRVELPEAPGGE